jgi:hypothetical protein
VWNRERVIGGENTDIFGVVGYQLWNDGERRQRLANRKAGLGSSMLGYFRNRILLGYSGHGFVLVMTMGKCKGDGVENAIWKGRWGWMDLHERGSYVGLRAVGRFVEERLRKENWIVSGAIRDSLCSVNFLMRIVGLRERVLLGHFHDSCG